MPCEHGYAYTDGTVAEWCPECKRMKDPDLTIEARVSALEAALAESEQWNTCACGHHGSVHSAFTNRCLTCECMYFSTKRRPNVRPAVVPDAETIASWDRISRFVNSNDFFPDAIIEDFERVNAHLTRQETT